MEDIVLQFNTLKQKVARLIEANQQHHNDIAALQTAKIGVELKLSAAEARIATLLADIESLKQQGVGSNNNATVAPTNNLNNLAQTINGSLTADETAALKLTITELVKDIDKTIALLGKNVL